MLLHIRIDFSTLEQGSNQYETKRKVLGLRTKSWKQIALITVVTASLAFGFHKSHMLDMATWKETLISPIAVFAEEYPETPEDEKKAIVKYIYEIFGPKDGKIACAIAMGESGLSPKAKLVWSRENSRGIFQINIQSDYAKVHYARIPGKTLEEKITWLENPSNNTLLAYWIFEKSGWHPWTAYKTGSYGEFLGKGLCK
jgi:hypothetical protein